MNKLLKNPNLSVIQNSHEIEKVACELRKAAKEDGNEKIETLSKRLEEAMKDLYLVFRTAEKFDPASRAIKKKILEKYKHNIPHVYEETEEA